MTNHPAAEQVAAEVRAALGRHRKTAADLAQVLSMTPHTAGRRLSGEQAFDVVELAHIAAWLDVPMTSLLPDTVSTVAAS